MKMHIDQNIMKYVPKNKQDAIEEAMKDSDGYWVYLKEGWNADRMDYQCRTIHEDNVNDLRYQIAGIRKVEEEEKEEQETETNAEEDNKVEDSKKFVEGGEYVLHCQSGAVAKRTATFVGWYNKKEGLFKIGATTKPVRIATDANGREFTQHGNWWAGGRSIFDKYENIVAETDRIK